MLGKALFAVLCLHTLVFCSDLDTDWSHLKPKFHFNDPHAWINDPNGLITIDGVHHLFYQHNKAGPFWGPPSWGHAISTDFLRWKPLEEALIPSGPDETMGCWSGSGFHYNHNLFLFYTAASGVKPDFIQKQSIAISPEFDTLHFKKRGVVNGVEQQSDFSGFRDPVVWKDYETNTFWMTLGGGSKKKGLGEVYLYNSTNLVDWKAAPSLYKPRSQFLFGEDFESIWECPDYFRINDDDSVLFVSVENPDDPGHVKVLIGNTQRINGAPRFTPRTGYMLDAGSLYALKSYPSNEMGSRVLMGWAREECSAEFQKMMGWSGILSVPRRVSMVQGGSQVKQLPIDTMGSLIASSIDLPHQPSLLPKGNRFWIHAFGFNKLSNIAFRLLDDGVYHTDIVMAVRNGKIIVKLNRFEASVPQAEANTDTLTISCDIEDRFSEVDIIVDGSIIEILGLCQSITARVYPPASAMTNEITSKSNVSGQFRSMYSV